MVVNVILTGKIYGNLFKFVTNLRVSTYIYFQHNFYIKNFYMFFIDYIH
jgi:hypothetical protein